MDRAAFTRLGFAAGLVKAAAGAGDNQPGPKPGDPAQPHTHRARNVALGAAVLAGGLLGTRHLARASMTAARQQRASRLVAERARLRAGEASAHALARHLTKNRPIGIGERAGALTSHWRTRARQALKPSRELQNQRFMAEHGIKAPPSSTPTKGRWRSLKRKALLTAAIPAAVGGGAIAGASAASRAREPQADD